MESITMTPEKAQKTMWNLIWGTFFIIGLALWLFMLMVGEKLVVNIFGAVWLVLMGLIMLYLPALFKSLIYSIEDDAIKMKIGVFWKKQVTVPYSKITNLDLTQGPLERYFNVGTIQIQTAGAGGSQGAQAELKMIGIRDTKSLKNNIMERVNSSHQPKTLQTESNVDQDSDPDVFKQILSELKAIRGLLAR